MDQSIDNGYKEKLSSVEARAWYKEEIKQLNAKKKLASIDKVINQFLQREFSQFDGGDVLCLPNRFLELKAAGIARELSIPENKNEFHTPWLKSYRIQQGILNNNKSDRRTTAGVFHVSDGGLPINLDKKTVPKKTFFELLKKALNPPEDLLTIPFDFNTTKTKSFVGLHLNPKMTPSIPGQLEQKRIQIRFFAPGSLVSNLDFVENIFGHAGDPSLSENDLTRHVDLFSGYTGCVILAPQMMSFTKKELGLPHVSEATPLQIEQGMAFEKEDELYNNGSAFKICHRTEDGVMITLIADNYFGYCKKEVKTQIGLAANLFGLAEEEHAGGALVFPRYSWGSSYNYKEMEKDLEGYSLAEVKELLKDRIKMHAEGYGEDTLISNLFYLPKDVKMSVQDLRIWWKGSKGIPLTSNATYMLPNGYRLRLKKHLGSNTWHLVGTVPEGTLLHKPATVSGGGKSEISKSLHDMIIHKNFYLSDIDKDMELCRQLIDKCYGYRFKDVKRNKKGFSRPFLDESRSLGSVVKLLTPSAHYTEEFNHFLRNIPGRIKALAFCVKNNYDPHWNGDWQSHFSVNWFDKEPGHELLLDGFEVISRFLRMGIGESGQWNTFRVRQDFMPSQKIQTEDDITVSVVWPSYKITNIPKHFNRHSKTSVKLVENVEYQLFQRPDEAVHKGLDKQTETDFATNHNFFANFEPLTVQKARAIKQNVIEYQKYSEPMKQTIDKACKLADGEYFVCSSEARIVNGTPTKNPRYLQRRPDLVKKEETETAYMGMHLNRKLDTKSKILNPVSSLLIGRRNNKADHVQGIKALAVYNPVHYQELPELLADVIASLSGKSPSTTGFGSEGALTKGPFNAIRTIVDLNNFLVYMALTGDPGFSTACGFVGNKYQVDHDISYWVPEMWARMSESERDPQKLISEGYFERLEDFEYQGKVIYVSRLGYRMTKHFVTKFCGRIFSNPHLVFPEELLKPELQNLKDFAEGTQHIANSQKIVAKRYLDDGSIEDACPPLKALLYILAEEEYQGMTLSSPSFRDLFKKESVLHSDWYIKRLIKKKERDISLWQEHLKRATESGEKDLLQTCKAKLEELKQMDAVESLKGTIGADLFGSYE